MDAAFIIFAPATLWALAGVRMLWVDQARSSIRAADNEAHQTLPTFNAMWIRFWIWNASRFLDWNPSHPEVERRADAKVAQRGAAIIRRNSERRR